MKRTFISILCIFTILSAFGQQESSADFTEAQTPINIGLDVVNKVDCGNITNQSSVDIKIIDLTGSTVFKETKYDIQFNPKLRIDLSTIKSGIYLVCLTDTNSKTITKRIIKN